MKRTTLQVFLEKPADKKQLLFRIFVLLTFTRFFILIFPFKWLSVLLGRKKEIAEAEEVPWPVVREISRHIQNVSKIVPWKATCLVQAATAKILLNKLNIRNTLCFGVNKNNETRELQAHAWLLVKDTVVVGGDHAEEFVKISSLS